MGVKVLPRKKEHYYAKKSLTYSNSKYIMLPIKMVAYVFRLPNIQIQE
jgi:hypothetical protein